MSLVPSKSNAHSIFTKQMAGEQDQTSGASDCVFCSIVASRIPAAKVYEDEQVLAIMDIRPINEGHVLVLPKQHYPGLVDLPRDVWAHQAAVARDVGDAIRRSGVRCEGNNLFLSDGRSAFQEVPHIHLHVIPRFQGDGFKLKMNRGKPSRGDLDNVAMRIAMNLSKT